MEPILFACMAPLRNSELPFNVPLFAASIRTFAGTLSDSPLWVFIPQPENEIFKVNPQLESLDVQIIPFAAGSDSPGFSFAGFVQAAAIAESRAATHTKFLAWMGLDTVIMKEPAHFLLDDNKIVGYRPVHHTLIGSLYNNPLDPFWKLVYQKCHVSDDAVFPMKPHVDHNILRPYFNAAHLVVRPEKRLLQTWWKYFKALYHDPGFEAYYKENELYTIFFHQAVLSGVILSTVNKQELQELPFTYNYPLHLYDESPPDLRPENVDDLVTVRYENLEVLKTFPFDDPFRIWLNNQLNSLR